MLILIIYCIVKKCKPVYIKKKKKIILSHMNGVAACTAQKQSQEVGGHVEKIHSRRGGTDSFLCCLALHSGDRHDIRWNGSRGPLRRQDAKTPVRRAPIHGRQSGNVDGSEKSSRRGVCALPRRRRISENAVEYVDDRERKRDNLSVPAASRPLQGHSGGRRPSTSFC